MASSIPSFLFGAGTKYKTQEELDRAREQVRDMLGDIGNSKFEGWGSFLADIGKGIGAGLEQRRISEGQEGLSAEQSKLWEMFGGGGYSGADPITGEGGADAAAGGGAQDEFFSGGDADGAKATGTAISNTALNTGRDPMALATSLLGKREVPDRSTIKEYLKNGGANLDPATTAWCAAFVNSSLKQAGIEGTGSNMAKSFLNYGTATKTPKKGDLAVFQRGDPKGPFGHVGFFDSLNPDGTIRVLGGNQGSAGGVSYSNYPASRLLGYRSIGDLSGAGGASGQAGGAGTDPMVTGSTTPPPVPVRNVPIADAGLRTPAGADFLSRMGNPAPMGGQPLPMVPTMTGPMPPPQPPQPAPVPPPAPAPAPPAPPPQVDPFTDMILGDKASQFKPGNYVPPAPVGKQVFPAAPPAPGTPAAAGFGVPPVVGGGGADQLAGQGTFPPAPAPPQAQAGGGDKIAKLMFVLSSPYASDEQKRMATAMLSREYELEDERRKAASPEAQLDVEYKRAQIDEIKRKQTEDPSLINLGDGVLYDPKTRKVVYDQSQQGGPKPPDFDDTSGVRKEITALPSYKNLAQATPIWSSVVSAADRKTTQADLNIILGIAKIMDPTSVVRTEEGESVRDTGGATTELSKWFSYLKSNSDAVLDDSIREKLLNEGYSRVKGYEDEYAADTEFYGQFADRKKIDRADIIRAFTPARQWRSGGANPAKRNKYGSTGGGR